MWSLTTISLSASFAAAAITHGSFSTLSLNVAGLPSLLSSGNPEVNTPLISPRLKPYNLIHVQEDFNYHAALYASDSHTFRTPTSGGVPFGSGLNTLSDFPYVNFERVTWDTCFINDGDCLTPKGFTAMRLKIADGVWIDAYNLHGDAGDESGDITARASDFAQLTAYIAQYSVGMPIIVFGDTNTRYSRAGDSEILHSFLTATGTVDSWITNIRKGDFPPSGSPALVCPFPFPVGTPQATLAACEVVDKQFTRSSAALTLTATSYVNANDAFVNSTGYPLSDHYPIANTLSWALSSSLRLGDPAGGPHGTYFNDLQPLFASKAVPRLTSLTLRGAERVDAVSFAVAYPTSSTATSSYGGTGGSAATYTLASTERITQILACSGQVGGDTRVFYLAFTTNVGRTMAVGKSTTTCITSVIPTDAGASGKAWGLIGFWGRSGDEVDMLAPIWGAGY